MSYSETLSQTISGLVAGKQYSLSFYQAGAQQKGFVGATYDQWKVTFGGSTRNSTLMNVPNGGVVGWMAQTMIFTAAATSQTLAFLAVGAATGDPPMALPGGVSLVEVPAPFAVLGLGFAGLARLRRRRARALASSGRATWTARSRDSPIEGPVKAFPRRSDLTQGRASRQSEATPYSCENETNSGRRGERRGPRMTASLAPHGA